MTDFKQHLLNIISHGALSISISLGLKLGLFDALANFSEENPATAEAIAEQKGLKPRYVFEWLSSMVCGDIIETDKDGRKFWVAENKREIVTGSKDPLFSYNVLIPFFGEYLEALAKSFDKDEPSINHEDLHKHPRFHAFGHVFNTSKHANIEKYLFSDYLPRLGVREKLEKGIDVLDVGCGPGMQVIELANAFPNSRFIGFDVSEKAIERAQQVKEEKGLKNVEFLLMDAKEFKPEWTNKFDLIISFDSFHHHEHPDKAIKEVYRVLKPGGLFALIEINGTSNNAAVDKQTTGLMAVCTYTMGLYHRKPEEDPNAETIGMFNLWGVELVKQQLKEIGFIDIKAEKTPFFELNAFYMARK